MIFEGGILGNACHFHGDPYLNGTTVLFDIETYYVCMPSYYKGNILSLQHQ